MDRAHDEFELYTYAGPSLELGDVVVAYICNEDTGEEHEEDSILGGVIL